MAPFTVPLCLLSEIEFAERLNQKQPGSRFFPVRFLWVMAGHEQRAFGLAPLGRCRYHPEKLFHFWEEACSNIQYRRQREAQGFLFDLEGRAVEFSVGWIYIGNTFVEDFLTVESLLGIEMLFPDPNDGVSRPVFQAWKRDESAGEGGGHS